MNTENEIGVKVPKGQINYNTVAGSLGLAAFAGLGLRNWLGNGNGSVAADAAEICPVVELAARVTGPAVPDPNAPTTPTANA